jgi:hypothetical protein
MQVRSVIGAGVVSLGVGAALVGGAGLASADATNSNGPGGDTTTTTSSTTTTDNSTTTKTNTTIKDSYNTWTKTVTSTFTDRSVSFLNGNKVSAFNGNFSGNTVKVEISAGNGILKDGIGNGNVLKNLFSPVTKVKFPVTVTTITTNPAP